MSLSVITPDWRVPASVVAFTTTTIGGVSENSYASLNLGTHVGDNPTAVEENRRRLQTLVGAENRLCWLQQTHSDIIINTEHYTGLVEGDAAVANQTNQVCLVMTADCLPVLLCNEAGTKVAALHCGWKGLQQNLIRQTVISSFQDDQVIAWLGPAIAQDSYEVDTTLYQRFTQADGSYAPAFIANRAGHYLMDLYAIAHLQLIQVGVRDESIFGGGFDTFSDARFFSHRRDPHSGRMASLIYLQAD